MLGIIWYMIRCTHLHDRHDKSDFFFLFYFIIDLLSWECRVKSTTWNSLSNIFSVNNFCVPTELCFTHFILILSSPRVKIDYWIDYCSSILSSNILLTLLNWRKLKFVLSTNISSWKKYYTFFLAEEFLSSFAVEVL